jgi:HSP20 family protein
MAPTKLPEETALSRTWPSFTWPTWRWLDEVFRDAGGGQLLVIEELTEGDELVIRAELPGIDPDKDVQVEVDDGMLRISAQRTESSEKKERHVHRSEFRYGSFVRTIAVPKDVQPDRITATYKDGVLEVRVPESAAAKQAVAHKVKVLHG